jgi:hypothetical protein
MDIAGDPFVRTILLVSAVNTAIVLAGILVEVVLWRRIRKQMDESLLRCHSDY